MIRYMIDDQISDDRRSSKWSDHIWMIDGSDRSSPDDQWSYVWSMIRYQMIDDHSNDPIKFGWSMDQTDWAWMTHDQAYDPWSDLRWSTIIHLIQNQVLDDRWSFGSYGSIRHTSGNSIIGKRMCSSRIPRVFNIFLMF